MSSTTIFYHLQLGNNNLATMAAYFSCVVYACSERGTQDANEGHDVHQARLAKGASQQDQVSNVFLSIFGVITAN